MEAILLWLLVFSMSGGSRLEAPMLDNNTPSFIATPLECPERERGLVRIRTEFTVKSPGLTKPPRPREGTGFIVRDASGSPRVITASHVVNYTENPISFIPNPKGAWGCSPNNWRPLVLLRDGARDVADDVDIAILQFETGAPDGVHYLRMVEPTSRNGQYAFFGYPEIGSDSDGEHVEISSPRVTERVQLSEPFPAGFSGSPLRNEDGEVVGIATNNLAFKNRTEVMLFVGRVRDFIATGGGIKLGREAPRLGDTGLGVENLEPAASNESLVIIFAIQGPSVGRDVTTAIRNALQAELKPGPNSSIVSLMNKWRIEQSGRARTTPKATLIGEDAGSLFVITGSHDGKRASLEIALTDRTLFVQDEELEQIGIRLDSSPIGVELTLDNLSSQLVPIAVFLKGVQLYVSRDIKSAEDHFDRVIKTSSQSMLIAQSHFLRGICRYLRSQYDLALDDYNAALGLGLTLPAVYWRRAQLSLKPKFSHLNGDLQKGIEISRGSAQSYYVAGLLTFEKMLRIVRFSVYQELPADFDLADDYLRVAMEKDPTRLAPIITRVRLYERFGDYLERESLKTITSFISDAIDRGGDRPELRVILAQAYIQRGEVAKALQDLERAAVLGAPNGQVQLAKALAYEQSGDLTGAIRCLDSFLVAGSGAPGEWWLRANVKARVASLRRGERRQSAFKSIVDSEAERRRKALQTEAISWINRTWNRDFHGSRSTEDFFLWLLTGSRIIPTVPDRESAVGVTRSLLGERTSDRITVANTPAWCESSLMEGTLLVLEVPGQQGVKGIYLSGPDGKVLAVEQTEPGFGFSFACYHVRTDLQLEFSGD